MTIDHISKLKEFLGKEVVIHHADHQNQNAKVFLPPTIFSWVSQYVDRSSTLYEVGNHTTAGDRESAEAGDTMASTQVQMEYYLGSFASTRIHFS